MKQKNLTRQELSYRLELTPYGFDQMIKNQTMKVSHLEKLSQVFKVPISYWFDDSVAPDKEPAIMMSLEDECPNAIIESIQDQVDILKNQIQEKDDQIRSLLEVLKGKNK